MKLTNTYISKDCTRKVLMYVDKNGHYEIRRYKISPAWQNWEYIDKGKEKFKHIESAQRAINKFIQ